MKFILALTTLFAAALAQSTTSTQAPTTTAPLTPQQSCLNACKPGDVNCQAICVGVPHPGNAQMDSTTDCVAKCDQGDGSKAASDKYAACRNACISSYIITSGTAAPGGAYTTAGASGKSDASATGSAKSGASSGAAASGSAGASGSAASGSAKASSSSGAAVANSVSFGITGGLLGLAAAML